jgi:uncharacterized protein YcbX
MIRITHLNIYPLKSGAGIAVDRFDLDRFGPANDRRWMVVDPDGVLVTQREIVALRQVAATPNPERLTLQAPGREALDVPRDDRAPRRTVRVWDDQVEVVDAGDPAAQWLSDFLGRAVRLTYFPSWATRRTSRDYDPIGSDVGFADGYPILVVGQASLDDLNLRLATPLPMNRFRPNVVVSGTAPWEEDQWRRFSNGPVAFDAVKPCARCVMTTTDHDTGERASEPLRTLATFRKQGAGVMFGMNVVHRGPGTLRVGDTLTIETRA